MKPATASSDDQARRRPSGVFNGTTVKRKFVDAVLSAIRQTATAHETFIEGNMVSSRQRDE